MMEKNKAYNRHPAHKALFHALAVSLSVDEDDMDKLAEPIILKKHQRDDHNKDPFDDPDKDSKKKKRKDHDVSSSKKTKDQPTSSKGTSPSKSSKIDTIVQAEERVDEVVNVDQEAVIDEEPAVDEVVNVDVRSQDNIAPTQDRSKWFKQSRRRETPTSPDPVWSKDPNTDAGQEQDWFPDLEKTVKAPEEFNDLLGTTFDFSNFVKHHLKKDKLTKVDLEGPVFKLLKGTCRSSIELEYHSEQRCLAFSDKLDWTNPEGDRIPQDLSEPLPLLGAPGHLYIRAYYFFNKDLEYLRSGNLEERKYTASFTKAKATRYELYGIKEMTSKQ
ncbi:hypothetical protein Tco_1500653 [Tanacetum coccineum]